jgi:hypothetical protein
MPILKMRPADGDKEFMYVYASTALVNGDVVIFDHSSTNQPRVTTTTEENDPAVAGVAIQTITAATHGWIQTWGYHSAVKLDGSTVNIAKGDALRTTTTTKKDKKGNGLGISLATVTTDTTAAVWINANPGVDVVQIQEDLDMNSNRITELGTATALSDALPASAVAHTTINVTDMFPWTATVGSSGTVGTQDPEFADMSYVSGATADIQYASLDFATTGREESNLQFMVPDWLPSAATTMTTTVYCTVTTSAAGGAVFVLKYRTPATGEAVDGAYTAASAICSAATNTWCKGDAKLSTLTSNATTWGGVAGDFFVGTLFRKTDDATDALGADIHVHAVKIVWS